MRLIKLLSVVLAALSLPCVSMATIYYVSPIGSDSALGTSTGTPWKTVAKVNATKFGSTDQVLFQRGGIWREMLQASVTGIYYGAYGTGNRPTFDGADVVTGTWASGGAHSCTLSVGGDDMTNVWVNGVVGAPVTGAQLIVAPGQWFYSGGTLWLGFAGACSAISPATVVEVTRRPYALSVDGIGTVTIEHLAFINGMYNSVNFGSNMSGTQILNDVVWKGAAYEGFISNSGTPVITGSEGLYSLSGLAVAGGNGLTLTNSILSGNTLDAIEIYGTNGASTIVNSTISGNSTATPLSATISNWSAHPLTATNSILLPNPYIPVDYSFEGLTQDATDVEESPLFTARAAPVIVVPFIDDYINLGVAEQVAAVAKTNGCPISYALNTKLVTPSDWTRVAAIHAAGNEIVAHTRSHPDLANNNVFTIGYAGPAKTATLTINQTTGNLQTFLNGSTTADLTVPILDKWNSIQNLCTAVTSKPNYTCVVQQNQLYFTPLNLANVSGVSIIPGYTTVASSNYLTWEVEGAQADIAANIPGYKATTFATPFTSSNLTVEAHIQNAGFLANRNGTVDGDLNPNGNWMLSELDVYNIAAEWLPEAFDNAHPAGSLGALVEGLGAGGGVFAIYSHGYDEFSLAQWTNLFQLLKQTGASCMTLSQARQYIGSHGTLVPDGTSRVWSEQVPLNPNFSTTALSPTQGAHGLQ